MSVEPMRLASYLDLEHTDTMESGRTLCVEHKAFSENYFKSVFLRD